MRGAELGDADQKLDPNPVRKVGRLQEKKSNQRHTHDKEGNEMGGASFELGACGDDRGDDYLFRMRRGRREAHSDGPGGGR